MLVGWKAQLEVFKDITFASRNSYLFSACVHVLIYVKAPLTFIGNEHSEGKNSLISGKRCGLYAVPQGLQSQQSFGLVFHLFWMHVLLSHTFSLNEFLYTNACFSDIFPFRSRFRRWQIQVYIWKGGTHGDDTSEVCKHSSWFEGG